MAAANIIPLNADVAADIARQHALPMCTVLVMRQVEQFTQAYRANLKTADGRVH